MGAGDAEAFRMVVRPAMQTLPIRVFTALRSG